MVSAMIYEFGVDVWHQFLGSLDDLGAVIDHFLVPDQQKSRIFDPSQFRIGQYDRVHLEFG